MWRFSFVILTVITALTNSNRLEEWSTVEDFTDVCMDGQQHKTVPGPEAQLFNLVSSCYKK